MVQGKCSLLVLPIQEHVRGFLGGRGDISQFSLLPSSPSHMEFHSAVAFGKTQAAAGRKHGRSTCFYLSDAPKFTENQSHQFTKCTKKMRVYLVILQLYFTGPEIRIHCTRLNQQVTGGIPKGNYSYYSICAELWLTVEQSAAVCTLMQVRRAD